MVSTSSPHDFDLVIIGTGSGNSVINAEMDDWRIAVVERDVFGGTCLNRGCIPSKILVYAADVAHTVRHSERLGVHGRFDGADWPAIRDRVFGRIDPIAEAGRQYRAGNHNVTVFQGDARFVGERELEVDGQRIRGDQVVIATGAHSFVPDIPGLHDGPFQTSDTIMRIGELPQRLIVLGGGFVATELGYVFSALGSRVSIVNRSNRLLVAEDDDVSARYTELAPDLFADVVLGATVDRVEHHGGHGGVTVHLHDAGGERRLDGDVLLLATGRRPNGDEIGAELAGVEVADDGHVVVDEYGRTSAPRVWALGDVNGRYQLKHMANGEAKVVSHNVLHPDDLHELDHRAAPHAVFSSPQIGSVGVTEQQARQGGGDICVVTHDYSGAAYGWALEDSTSFAKLIGDPHTRQLLGAHVIGYQGSLLVQLLVQGMHLGSTVDEIALGQIWIHPALSEVVEQALLKLIDAFDAFTPDSHPRG